MRYLDPKNDLTFKKIFGEHPAILMDLLNAFFPFESGNEIVSLTYMSSEQVPQIPDLKNSLVDVKCIDKNNRIFIIEMQMLWTDSFMHRVVFNASKAFVRQLGKGKKYESLNPVFAFSLVNENYDSDVNNYFHHYKIIEELNTKKQLQGLEFLFIELPKALSLINNSPNKNQQLWIRFFNEIIDGTEVVSEDLLINPQIKDALEYLQESAFTTEELEIYDQYWDSVSREKSLIFDSERNGKIEGRIEGRIEGHIEGEKQGSLAAKIEGIKKSLIRGKLSLEEIAEDFEVSLIFIREIKEKHNL